MERYLTTTFLHEIVYKKSDIHISIYMPTHRTAPDNKQDVVRFKNIVTKLENDKIYETQVRKLKELEHDLDFWRYNLDGLAILLSDDDMVIYRLPIVVDEMLYIGERFYVLPLIKNYQRDHRYYALGLARDNFRLYSGNQYGFREVELDDEVRLLDNVLGDQREKIKPNVAGHGGGSGIHFGHTSKSDEIAIDTKKFFSYVDEYVYNNYCKESKIPLILISLPEHQGIFRGVSKNKYLLGDGINKSYESINVNDLSNNLWDIILPNYRKTIDNLKEAYEIGINNDKAFNTIQKTLEGLIKNQVHTLVLEDNKVVLGFIDYEDVSFKLDDSGNNILNELALLALELDVNVLIVEKADMPASSGVFSLLRY